MKAGDIIEYVDNSNSGAGIEVKRVGKRYQIRELVEVMGQQAARCYKLKKDGNPDKLTNTLLMETEIKVVSGG